MNFFDETETQIADTNKNKTQEEDAETKEAEIPKEFLCPITMEVMSDPVIISDGHSYERAAILAWLEKNNKSPMTNVVLNNKDVFTNFALRSLIRNYMDNDMRKRLGDLAQNLLPPATRVSKSTRAPNQTREGANSTTSANTDTDTETDNERENDASEPNLNGRRVASASSDMTVKVWNVSSGECNMTLVGHTNTVRALRAYANSTRLASASDDLSLKIWSLESGECVSTMQEAHDSWITTLEIFKVSGRELLLSGSTDTDVNVWDLGGDDDDATLRYMRTLAGHKAAVKAILTLSDTLVASGANDNAIKVSSDS